MKGYDNYNINGMIHNLPVYEIGDTVKQGKVTGMIYKITNNNCMLHVYWDDVNMDNEVLILFVKPYTRPAKYNIGGIKIDYSKRSEKLREFIQSRPNDLMNKSWSSWKDHVSENSL